MITVTFYGPVASGKTTAIEEAIKLLTGRGYRCANAEGWSDNATPPKDLDVIFKSVIEGSELLFEIDCSDQSGTQLYWNVNAECELAVDVALDRLAEEKAAREAKTTPAGDYAILEMFGHSTLVGRICEVERFGSKMLQIEPIWQDALLPPVHVGGASIYRLTPCSADVAFKRQPQHTYQLPDTLRATLAAPEPAKVEYYAGGDLDDVNF